MNQSENIGALAKALRQAQAQMGTAVKDSTNPHFKSKYADLASCLEACRKPLTDNGLSVIQPVSADGASVTVTTRLLHESGEFIEDGLTITAVQNTPQGIGSAITYGRRYGLCAMIGLAADDDDGNAASQRLQTYETTGHLSGYTVDPPEKVVDVNTGEEVPPEDGPEPPPGYHYIHEYKKSGEWHEFTILRYFEDGGQLKLSTKRDPIGFLAGSCFQDGIPVRVEWNPKKKGSGTVHGEGYVNKVESYKKELPVPEVETLDSSDIPF